MTNEEKVRAYDEALKRAKNQRSDYQKELDKTNKNSQLAGLLRAGISAIDMIFPELAESNDERIIHLLRELGSLDAAKELYEEFDLSYTDVLCWLEKQKEQKPVVTINGKPIPTENQSVDISLTEWSEDDAQKIGALSSIIWDYAFHIDALDENNDLTGEYAELDNWLESLPERFNLKPKH